MVSSPGISAGLKMVDTESTTPGMRQEKLQHSTSADRSAPFSPISFLGEAEKGFVLSRIVKCLSRWEPDLDRTK